MTREYSTKLFYDKGAPVLYRVHPKNYTHALRWRHDERDGVSNHQPHHCLLNRLFRHRSKKTSKLRITDLCEGNSPVTGEFPAQMASKAFMYCCGLAPVNFHMTPKTKNYDKPKQKHSRMYILWYIVVSLERTVLFFQCLSSLVDIMFLITVLEHDRLCRWYD